MDFTVGTRHAWQLDALAARGVLAAEGVGYAGAQVTGFPRWLYLALRTHNWLDGEEPVPDFGAWVDRALAARDAVTAAFALGGYAAVTELLGFSPPARRTNRPFYILDLGPDETVIRILSGPATLPTVQLSVTKARHLRGGK